MPQEQQGARWNSFSSLGLTKYTEGGSHTREVGLEGIDYITGYLHMKDDRELRDGPEQGDQIA